MAKGGYRAEAYKPERLVEYNGKLCTLKSIMADTGFSYSKTYRLFCQPKPIKNGNNLKTKKNHKEKAGKQNKKSDGNDVKFTQRGQLLLEEVQEKSSQSNKTPLEYMLSVMNDPEAPIERRDRMAMSAAPFVHDRGEKKGKKELTADGAKKAASGKFASGSAPKVVNIKR